MASSTAAIVIACISGTVTLAIGIYTELGRRRVAARQHAQTESLEQYRREGGIELKHLEAEQKAVLDKLQQEATRELEAIKNAYLTQREERTRGLEAEKLVARYRDPLLRSAFDLQSRLYNVLRGVRILSDPPDYYVENTLFAIAEYLGWLEVIRRDMQFLDLGAVDLTRELARRVAATQHRLSTSQYPDTLYIYRGHQRAIGELMLEPIPGGSSDKRRYDLKGYVAFSTLLQQPASDKWFKRLRNSYETMPVADPHGRRLRPEQRLVDLHGTLLDLIDFLDPECIRFAGEFRERWPPSARTSTIGDE